MDWTLTPYLPQHAADWNTVADRARNGTFLHSRRFMDYHAHRFDECSLLIYHKNRPVALFPANRSGEEAVSHAGLTFGGLVYDSNVYAADVLTLFDRIAEQLRSTGIRRVRYKAVPHIFQRQPAEDDLYALFRHGARLIRRDASSAIDLQQALPIRRALNASRHAGLRIDEGDFFAPFHAILTATLAAHGAVPVHTLDELLLLKARNPAQIRLFGAFDGTRLLAACLLFDHGATVHTQYLASTEEGRARGALDTLLAALISRHCAGRRWFSFGISTEQDGRHLNTGLIKYKEDFGARCVVHDTYMWDLP